MSCGNVACDNSLRSKFMCTAQFMLPCNNSSSRHALRFNQLRIGAARKKACPWGLKPLRHPTGFALNHTAYTNGSRCPKDNFLFEPFDKNPVFMRLLRTVHPCFDVNRSRDYMNRCNYSKLFNTKIIMYSALISNEIYIERFK